MTFDSVQLDKSAGTGYEQECRFTDLSDDCTFIAYYDERNGNIMVDVEPDKSKRS